MDIRLKIVDSGVDAQVYWLDVALLAAVGKEQLDVDRFRFARQTKNVLLNPDPGGMALPEPVYKEREANVFDYASLADIAARHFLRRQEKIERHAAGLAWAMAGWHKMEGQDVAPGLSLAQRYSMMRGAVLLVDAPDIAGALKSVPRKPGTVTTISADFDGWLYVGGDCYNNDIDLMFCRESALWIARIYIRFPLGVIGGADSVTDVDFKVKVINSTSNDADVQAYNQNGQADPLTDDCATRKIRTVDDASPYLDNDGFSSSTGIKTLQLPAAANTDVQNAKAAVNRFSIGINEDDGGDNNTGKLEALEAPTADEPKLVVTHVSAGFPYSQVVTAF